MSKQTINKTQIQNATATNDLQTEKNYFMDIESQESGGETGQDNHVFSIKRIWKAVLVLGAIGVVAGTAIVVVVHNREELKGIQLKNNDDFDDAEVIYNSTILQDGVTDDSRPTNTVMPQTNERHVTNYTKTNDFLCKFVPYILPKLCDFA
ncbi:unnamed protein product [Owenia fusiformis]|uniref:Uncharacterized protein n=1 Tax=Owenia fusiformis TaxID=6347 RepID=A0A8S4QA30_OWEFU|nr:unnamed protein product [Owenia fusiformis]